LAGSISPCTIVYGMGCQRSNSGPSARSGAMTFSAASCAPATIPSTATTGWPRHFSGTKSNGGAVTYATAQPMSSLPWLRSRHARTTSAPLAGSNAARPPYTIGGSAPSLNSISVTTPKLPPAPLRPQSSSGFSFSEAVTSRPSAVTTSARTTLSAAKPYLRSSQPLPVPVVKPTTPVVVTRPPVTARLNACVSRSSSPQFTPPWARTVFPFGSTRMPFIARRSSTIPSSTDEKPATEWPPFLIAKGRPLVRASPMPRMTSAAPAGRRMTRGRRSNIPLKTPRSSSYRGSDGSTISPRNSVRSCSRASASRAGAAIVVAIHLPPRCGCCEPNALIVGCKTAHPAGCFHRGSGLPLPAYSRHEALSPHPVAHAGSRRARAPQCVRRQGRRRLLTELLDERVRVDVLPAAVLRSGDVCAVELDERVDEMAADGGSPEQLRQLGVREEPVRIPGRPVRIVAVGDPIDEMVGLCRLVQEIRDACGFRHARDPLTRVLNGS